MGGASTRSTRSQGGWALTLCANARNLSGQRLASPARPGRVRTSQSPGRFRNPTMNETTPSSTRRRIRVMSVDDHDMVRRGLAVFFEAIDDFEMVGEAASGSEALQMLNTARPDVVMMGLMMPDMDGGTVIRVIRQTHPTIQGIALTSFKEEELVQAALQD